MAHFLFIVHAGKFKHDSARALFGDIWFAHAEFVDTLANNLKSLIDCAIDILAQTLLHFFICHILNAGNIKIGNQRFSFWAGNPIKIGIEHIKIIFAGSFCLSMCCFNNCIKCFIERFACRCFTEQSINRDFHHDIHSATKVKSQFHTIHFSGAISFTFCIFKCFQR